MTARRSSIVLAGAALALGLACLAYGATSLPGRGLVRGHLGDVAAVAFLYALVALVVRAPVIVRVALVAVVAVVVELTQRGGEARGPAGQLLVGAHFDPWDLAAYALGLAAAVAWERRARRGR